MALVDDIAAIRNDPNKTDAQKRSEVYQLKGTALIDVIYNGKPAPNPLPPLIHREFTKDGITIFVNYAKMITNDILLVNVTVTRPLQQPVVWDLRITNPPVLPRQITGNEKQDLIDAAFEMVVSGTA